MLRKRARIFRTPRRIREITQNSKLLSTLLIQNPKFSCQISTRNAAVIMLTLSPHPRALETLLHLFPRCTITACAPPVALLSSFPNASFPRKSLPKGLARSDWRFSESKIQHEPLLTIPPTPARYKYAVSHYTTARNFIFSLSLFLSLSLSLRLSSSFKAMYYWTQVLCCWPREDHIELCAWSGEYSG
jgi:hypothetical protein